MKRRNLLGWFLWGAILSRFPIWRNQLFPARAKDNEHSNFVAVGTITELQQQGQILDEESELGAILVFSGANQSLIAVDPTCTHAGCILEWNENDNLLICPCHGSQFTSSGEVKEGLAQFPLARYELKTDGDIILARKIDR